MKLNDEDKQTLAKLDDDFAISADGEVATSTGEMEIEIRPPCPD